MDLQTLNETLATSDTPVLIDFWAPWCGPCLRLAPTVDAIAEKYDGEVTVIKVNVDESREAASQFNVMSIPTLVAISADGERREFSTGAVTADYIEGLLGLVGVSSPGT